MNSLKALFTSALAIVLLCMLALFTGCSDQEPEPQATSSAPIHTTNYKPDLDAASLEMLEAESLAIEAATEARFATKNVSSEGISVIRSATCTGISKHEPVGTAASFSLDVGRVYLYTQVEMPKTDTGLIQHVWKFNGKPISVVELKVNGPTFRTRSYKTITEKMAGEWTVDVVTESGDIIETVTFSVE